MLQLVTYTEEAEDVCRCKNKDVAAKTAFTAANADVLVKQVLQSLATKDVSNVS